MKQNINVPQVKCIIPTDPDIIYILDTKGNFSTSEQAAQQKIYSMYLNTTNNPPENCGCGTAIIIILVAWNSYTSMKGSPMKFS